MQLPDQLCSWIKNISMNKKEITLRTQEAIRILVTIKQSYEKQGQNAKKICIIKTSSPQHDKILNINVMPQKHVSPYNKPNGVAKPVPQFRTRKLIDVKPSQESGTHSFAILS